MGRILVVENVSKSFGRLMAVNDVSFEVEENEIYGIAGPNGAGKTTLFNSITGIPFHADSGRIIFRDTAIQSLPPHVICHKGVARTFQKETSFDSLTVMENVLVGAAFGHGGKDKQVPRNQALKALELVGLADQSDREACNLSLFEQKRLMLASALVTQPKLLLLDEPAAGLNHEEIQQSAELIESINTRGITIVLIEHVLPLLLKLSQRVMILNEGRKLVEGRPQAVVKDRRVIDAYLGGGRDSVQAFRD